MGKRQYLSRQGAIGLTTGHDNGHTPEADGRVGGGPFPPSAPLVSESQFCTHVRARLSHIALVRFSAPHRLLHVTCVCVCCVLHVMFTCMYDRLGSGRPFALAYPLQASLHLL